MELQSVGFGGGCHWCTEAVYQALQGVHLVEQGFVKSNPPYETYSEAVLVEFDPKSISLGILIEIHLRTHASTSNHKMRGKYRSAVYVHDDKQREEAGQILSKLQKDFEQSLVTNVLDMVEFKHSMDQFKNYYSSDPNKPFCQAYIDPKLALLRSKYSTFLA